MLVTFFLHQDAFRVVKQVQAFTVKQTCRSRSELLLPTSVLVWKFVHMCTQCTFSAGCPGDIKSLGRTAGQESRCTTDDAYSLQERRSGFFIGSRCLWGASRRNANPRKHSPGVQIRSNQQTMPLLSTASTASVLVASAAYFPLQGIGGKHRSWRFKTPLAPIITKNKNFSFATKILRGMHKIPRLVSWQTQKPLTFPVVNKTALPLLSSN